MMSYTRKTAEILLAALFLLMISSCNQKIDQSIPTDDYTFVRDYTLESRNIPRNVLESYLSRALDESGFLTPDFSDSFPENLRMIINVGAKFIGRAALIWGPSCPEETYMNQVLRTSELCHQADPEMILQAAIFEIVCHSTPEKPYGVDLIPVPDWVFKAFNLPVEQRNFNYEAMLFPNGRHVGQWGKNGSVPDICQLETQMYFYYRAVRYIDAGIEAIHWGQVNLVGETDKKQGYKSWFSLLGKVKDYAEQHARRHAVLFDGHCHFGVAVDGKLLMDFHALDHKPVQKTVPYECELKVGFRDALYKRSKGGMTWSGWSCQHLPYLVEFDNAGADKGFEGEANHPTIDFPWGWDCITWFAHCEAKYRDYWLDYAWHWIRKTDPCGFLKMPGLRTIAADHMVAPDGHAIWSYTCNMKSPSAPYGFSQEDTIKQIWEQDK